MPDFDKNGPPITAGEVKPYHGGGGVPRMHMCRCVCGEMSRKGQRTCHSCHAARERKARAAGRRKQRKSRARVR